MALNLDQSLVLGRAWAMLLRRQPNIFHTPATSLVPTTTTLCLPLPLRRRNSEPSSAPTTSTQCHFSLTHGTVENVNSLTPRNTLALSKYLARALTLLGQRLLLGYNETCQTPLSVTDSYREWSSFMPRRNDISYPYPHAQFEVPNLPIWGNAWLKISTS